MNYVSINNGLLIKPSSSLSCYVENEPGGSTMGVLLKTICNYFTGILVRALVSGQWYVLGKCIVSSKLLMVGRPASVYSTHSRVELIYQGGWGVSSVG